jgi:rhamnulokinase
MGVEISQPRLNAKCSELNFTNEGGANGTVRLLKNISGLWPLQQCRASWQRRGKPYDWTTLSTLAAEAKPHAHWIDIQNPAFVAPEDMLDAVLGYMKQTRQPTPDTDGAIARAILESLAMRYRICLGMLEDLLGYQIETIHIVGGGVRNQLLCQMTADACNRTIVAGPVEATALGNVISQMLALGRFKNVGEARAWMLQTSSIDVYEPKLPAAWDEALSSIASHLS